MRTTHQTYPIRSPHRHLAMLDQLKPTTAVNGHEALELTHQEPDLRAPSERIERARKRQKNSGICRFARTAFDYSVIQGKTRLANTDQHGQANEIRPADDQNNKLIADRNAAVTAKEN